MLVTMKEILDKAMAGKYAVGAFNVPNLESIQATIEAAEELDVPVIIQHAQVHEDEGLTTLDEIGPTMVEYAKRAKVPVCVHLDHGVDFDYLVRAMHMGFTSVMIDASAKPYEENLAITKINYYTYGTMAGANAVRDYLATKGEGEKIFFHDIVAEAKKGIKADVKRAMTIFATNLLATR